MAKELTKAGEAERSINKKFRKEIWNRFIEAVKNYKLIDEGDKIAVCISGGKDSMMLAVLMKMLQKYSEVKFDLQYIVMDPGYNPENRKKIEDNAKILEIPIHVFETDIFEIADNVTESPCYLCARMRRGHLYAEAKKYGCNKIALGHHLSDVIETTLMGMMYGSQIQGMLPRLKSTNFEGMELIRPLYCILEDDIIRWTNYNELSFIACACKLTARAAVNEDASKRREIKLLIKELKKKNPDIEKNLFNSIHRCNVDTLVGYKLGDEMHSFLERFDRKI
ncbi:MAG: tRNA 2-thiocytidine biosynthesis protein TtcA [Clostridia bacterium]|nr:tRNA 2-thiocytidine biosynthesis protein TtcA [Clostridia bacterium]